ncbi:MAG TPA: ABC transporter permease [Gemmatimonadaceae bacterium]|nr:ABC transporter permease [Gemmatimonadaceae bacterium]
MLFREVLAVALVSLRANKLRSCLTMLGIVIGITAVITVVAIGTGAQRAVQARLEELGTTLLQINPRRVRRAGVQWTETRRLTMDDARLLAERGTHFAEIQPQQDRSLQVVFRNRNSNDRIVGTTPNYLRVHRYELAAGRMFTPVENETMQRVAVVGAQVIEELGLPSPYALLGETIRIRGQQFRVIGVLAPKGRATPFGNPDSQVLIPFRTGRFHVFGTDRLNDLYVLATSDSAVLPAMAEATVLMRRAHRLRYDDPDDFRIRNQSDFLSTLGETTQVFSYMLAGIAGVSLLVGGIGIMNIMLVSVTERTREIGIRKALGATHRTILLQFLLEAIVMCLLGGSIGVALGAGLATVMRESFGWNTAVAPAAVVGAFVFAAAIGVLFGLWPARRAAILDPIQALRYE